MKQVAQHLTEIIGKAIPLLVNISEEEASITPVPGKWSKKEVIGHLIDSACNNHQKFVRTMNAREVRLAGYDQDVWVLVQEYNTQPWLLLLQLLESYNLHLANVVSRITDEQLTHVISIDDKELSTLELIVVNYAEHLEHHLKAVLPKSKFLKDPSNVTGSTVKNAE